jgi:catechol 2,3-dioxygenase-like lactoylglutathione lyase family enzyme
MTVDFELELMWIPVSDVDRAKSFYLEQAGFDLLVDIPDGLPGQRIVQVTPPGSACSIGFGDGDNPAKPGSQQGLFIVADVVAARDELAARGVRVGEVQHIVDGAWVPGLHPARADYMSFVEFSDPDGNTWLLQERRGRPSTPDPVAAIVPRHRG